MTSVSPWVLQALPVSAAFWSHVYEIVAVALLLVAQSVWSKRTSGKAIDSKFADLRTAINANRDIATQEFTEVSKGMAELGHRIDLWAEKTNALADSVKGLLSREQARLEDDARATRRRRHP